MEGDEIQLQSCDANLGSDRHDFLFVIIRRKRREENTLRLKHVTLKDVGFIRRCKSRQAAQQTSKDHARHGGRKVSSRCYHPTNSSGSCIGHVDIGSMTSTPSKHELRPGSAESTSATASIASSPWQSSTGSDIQPPPRSEIGNVPSLEAAAIAFRSCESIS